MALATSANGAVDQGACFGIAPKAQAKFQQLQQQAEQWAVGVINLIVIFLLEVLLIPIVLLWIMFTVIRSLLLKS